MTIAAALLDGKEVDITIDGATITSVIPHNPCAADIDAHGLSVFPGLRNMHSHAPMTLFRGLGDDQPLEVWLKDYIWPAEQTLTDESVYRGTLQACNEMLASGITFFNDMYFHLPAMAHAVEQSGIRARLGLNVFGDADELLDPSTLELLTHPTQQVEYSIAPHSIYTVSATGLQRSAEACARLSLPMHIHMSETEKEVADCLREHGCRPWEWLRRLGVLDMVGDKIIAAHCLHLDDDEIRLIGRHGITCVHCPNSNLKLGSGYRFPMLELLDAGARVALGTDGSASSNNLDLIEAMKTAALLQKGWRKDPSAVPASLIMGIATQGSSIAPGQPADLFLVRLNGASEQTDGLSTLVYATHGESVALTIVGGRVVYSNGQMPLPSLMPSANR